MYRSRRDYHSTGARIMRKLKGKGWIAVATTALALGASIPATILAASPQAIQAVLTSAKSSNFDGKDTLSNDEAIQTESSKALDAITSRWTMNDLDTVKAEITRQKDLGLEAYVVQWGDTLSVIAEAIESDVQELADANGITDRDLILTGDILNGVLSEAESVVVTPAPAQTDNSNQVTPAQPSTPAPDTDKPVEEKPDTNKPVEEKPDTDKPVEEKPDTDKPVEENPDTDKPVEENPDTDKPVEEEPDTDKPVEEEPDTDKPVEEEPDTDKPVEEDPEVPETPETPEDEVVVTEVKETKTIDFKTETRENAYLPKGETKVVQEGKAGVETITYKVTKVNGKDTKREEIKREVTTQPVNKIVEVGTKVEYQEPTVTKTEHKHGATEIRNEVYNEVNNGANGFYMAGGAYQTGRLEFVGETENSYVDANGDTILEVTTNQRGYFTYTPNYYNDNTLEPGVNVTTVQGQEGYTEFGYTDIYKNGVYQTTRGFDNGIVVDATVGTVLRGTKDITGSRTWTEFTPIIAGTITTNDPNKSSSESYTVAGKDGYIAINYKSTNGGPAVEVSREVVDAVYHEVYNGTK